MLQKEKLLVSGMSCGHCEAAVRSELQALDGIRSIDVSAAGGFAEVTFDDLLVNTEMMTAAINDTGIYKVTGVVHEEA